MCTNPRNVHFKDACSGSVRTYVVPCGKCAECRKKSQMEFQALALHEALSSGIMHMWTLTYRTDTCPIALSESLLSEPPRVVGFGRGSSLWGEGKLYRNDILGGSPFDTTQYYRCCSLHREDVKNALKEFRRSEKELGRSLENFRYACFGEYGDKKGRPHYHMISFGLSNEQVINFQRIWNTRFGDASFGPELSKILTLDDIGRMSNYVSKYISKGVSSRWNHILPFVEKPRRQSSLNFGNFTLAEVDRLRSMMAATLTKKVLASLSKWCLDGRPLTLMAIHFLSLYR